MINNEDVYGFCLPIVAQFRSRMSVTLTITPKNQPLPGLDSVLTINDLKDRCWIIHLDGVPEETRHELIQAFLNTQNDKVCISEFDEPNGGGGHNDNPIPSGPAGMHAQYVESLASAA